MSPGTMHRRSTSSSEQYGRFGGVWLAYSSSHSHSYRSCCLVDGGHIAYGRVNPIACSVIYGVILVRTFRSHVSRPIIRISLCRLAALSMEILFHAIAAFVSSIRIGTRSKKNTLTERVNQAKVSHFAEDWYGVCTGDESIFLI